MDYYRRLQVTREADAEVIERAYKALSLKHHPDRAVPSERESANERMRRINEAYSTLRDPVRRRAYDAQLPPEGAAAWDVFWERGLVGLFVDRFVPRS